MWCTNFNYLVRSSEPVSGLVVDTRLKPCALLVHKGVTCRVKHNCMCFKTMRKNAILYPPILSYFLYDA